MRRRLVPFAFLLLIPLAAQRPTSIRCAHVLDEAGTGWRTDVDVAVLDGLVSRTPRRDENVDHDFGETWLLPGLIDLHTHLLLRPYDQMSWDDQVLQESTELRTLRALRHAERTFAAGFTVVRELGTEGAGFADIALRAATSEYLLLGPEILTSTRAIVATGCYGPRADDPTVKKGAQVADGEDGVRKAVREQVAAGADWIKVYADYRRAHGAPATPTFSLAELTALVAEATSAGVPVAAHASTDEGIRRAVLAGVRTVEHGTMVGEQTLLLMKERGVVLVPCLAANEAIVRYAGHQGPVVERLNAARIAFQRALAAGVTIACGSDAGVFAHGDNVRELELMVEYGMTPAQAIAAATTVAAAVVNTKKRVVRPGVIVVDGDPLQDIRALRRVRAVFGAAGELVQDRNRQPR
ncbi:MAG: amidohydrolase family protein [Planctomycetes bacterium]|nr:amidohydrolase family protein [Planctomycetota bacterium]